jgi:small subunit ribosomal protein S13
MAEKEFKHILRIANTDLDGNKQIANALCKIKGIGSQFANMICFLSKTDKTKKVGYLTEEEVKKLDEVIRDPAKFGCPTWFLNRRSDYEDGKDKHLLLSDLKFAQDNDIKRLRKIKSYKGIRHGLGLPVRGQRTKANFRKAKGKVTGVKKKKIKSGKV